MFCFGLNIRQFHVFWEYRSVGDADRTSPLPFSNNGKTVVLLMVYNYLFITFLPNRL